MSVQEPREHISSVRRITPQSTLPPRAELQKLRPDERDVLQRRLVEQAECVYDESFKNPQTERELLASGMPTLRIPNKKSRRANPNDDSGMDLLGAGASLGDDERRAFLQLNYCRYRVMRVLRDAKGRELSLPECRELARWETLVRAIRAELVRINMPLVLAMAKRTKITNVDPSDLISEGNLALLRSVDKFDCNRGFKFSTYACRAILKSFSRVASRVSRYRGYFPTEFDPTFEKSDFLEQRRRNVEDDCVIELKNILGKNLANLNDIERRVIEARFALDEAAPIEESPQAKTLEEVGEMIGVTKERVRQIQNKALNKLKIVLEDGILAPS